MKSIIMDKVLMFNVGTFMVSFVEVESLLKIVLLISSILYTIIKIIYDKGDERLDEKLKRFFNKKDNKDV